MERLVFFDLEIAAQMNADIVNIEVDREEQPDIDRIYMRVTQLIANYSGWPKSVFLILISNLFLPGLIFRPMTRMSGRFSPRY